MVEKFEELFKDLSPSVESKFKEFLYKFLKTYRDNPTKAKATHLIMNLPVGFFIGGDDVKELFVNNRVLSFNTLMRLLSDKRKLKKIIGGDDAV